MAWRCFLMSALVGFAAGGDGRPGGASSPLAPDVVPAVASMPVALPPGA